MTTPMMQQPQPQRRPRKAPKPDYGSGGPFSLTPLLRAIDMVDERLIAFEEALAGSDELTARQRTERRRAYEMVAAIDDPDVFPAARDWFVAQYDEAGWDDEVALHLRRAERGGRA